MAEESPVTILDVYAVDDETDEETLIGKVEYGPRGMLSVLEADPDHHAFLSETVARINGKESLAELTAPGPNAPRYALASRVVQRDDEAFLDVLQGYLQKYYGLSLG